MNDAPDQHCRSCGAPLSRTLLDLGSMPLANSFLTESQLDGGGEQSYPLHARVCDQCWLVQVDEVVPPEAIFSDYRYFSSVAESWIEHARHYALMTIDWLALDGQSLVVEVGSNDGYLLRAFAAEGVGVLGIEPAATVADVAITAGIPTEKRFFGLACAQELVARGQAADLVVANNVLAHAPDLDDFVGGLVALLKPEGVLTIEVPHLLRMLERVEFDTIYHEHLCCFSLLSAQTALEPRGLRIFDVEELPTHGGSLRIWAGRADTSTRATTDRVEALVDVERAAGLDRPDPYDAFAERVERVRASLRGFLDDARKNGAMVAGYGAAAKGSTLLNSVGATVDDIAYVVDRSPHKVGRFLPGSHIPIHAPDHAREQRPDYLVLLAWNLRDEIIEQMADVKERGCQFVVPIPDVEVLS